MLVAEPILALERQVERLEAENAAWRNMHGGLSPEEHQAEVNRIAKEVTVEIDEDQRRIATLEHKLADAEALVLDNVGARRLVEERLAALTAAMAVLKSCDVLKRSLYPISDWQVISDALNQPEAPAESVTCLWTRDEDDIYASACGETWYFDDGSSLADNNCRFCFYCGKGIKEATDANENEA